MLKSILPIIITIINLVQTQNINIPQYNVPLSQEIQEFIYIECQNKDVEFELILGMIELESSFNADLVCKNDNGTQDRGLMQINSCRDKELTEQGYDNLLDPYQNIEVGITIIADLLHKYEDEHKALICYNMGESGGKRQFDKGVYTTAYSRKVIEYKNKYKEDD